MSFELKGSDKTTLIRGVLVVVSILLLPRGLAAIERWNQAPTDRVLHLRERETRAGASIRSALEYRRSGSNERLTAHMDSLLLSGRTVSAASVSLVEVLNEAASTSSVRIGSIDIRVTPGTGVPGSSDSLLVVSGSFTAAGSVASIIQFIGWLEQTPPLLAIESLSMSVQGGSAVSDDRVARVRLHVAGIAEVDGRRGADKGSDRQRNLN